MRDYIQIATQYESDVIEGRIPSCEWIVLSCKRSRADREKYVGPDSPYRFDSTLAVRACKFIERLRTTEDSIATKAGDRIVLSAWQVWIVAAIFGWVVTDGTETRRFSKAILMMGRGNGKSTLAGAVSLYTCFASKTGGAEGVCAASQKEQAGIIFETCSEMLRKDPDLCRILGLKVEANRITQPKSNSRLYALPAKASSAEGLKTSMATLDELHLARGRKLYEALGSGVTKRGPGALYLLVSTAGDDTSGIAWELVEYLRRVLRNEAEDPTTFCALYGMDDEGDWTSPVEHQKANPNWNVSVSPRSIEEACRRAQNMPGEKRNFLVKHCNSWLSGNGADEDFFSALDVANCYQQDLRADSFAGGVCSVGLDISSVLDLSSVYRVYMRRDEHKRPVFYAFGRNFLPAKRIQNPGVAAVTSFAARGEVVACGDSSIRQDDIEKYLLEDVIAKNKVRRVLYDPFQAAMLIGHVTEKTGKQDLCVETRQLGMVLTAGIKEMQAAVADGRFKTNDSCLLWCMRNLRCRTIGMNFLSPVRPDQRDRKIDSAVAVIMAFRDIALLPLDESGPKSYFLRCAELREQGKPVPSFSFQGDRDVYLQTVPTSRLSEVRRR